MTEQEQMYWIKAEDFQGRFIVQMVGTRATVLEATLRAILDMAGDWQTADRWPQPHFRISVWKFKA